MAQITFSDLKTKIQAYTENDGTEFVAALTDFISDAEDRLSIDLDISATKDHDDVSLNPGDPFLGKPNDAVVIRSLSLVDGTGDRHIIERRPLEFVLTYAPNRTTLAQPKYYAEWDVSDLYLAPTPDDAYTVEASFTIRIPKLSDNNTTNWYSIYVPHLLFDACMVNAEKFNKQFEDPAVQIWEASYQTNLRQARKEAIYFHHDEDSLRDKHGVS